MLSLNSSRQFAQTYMDTLDHNNLNTKLPHWTNNNYILPTENGAQRQQTKRSKWKVATSNPKQIWTLVRTIQTLTYRLVSYNLKLPYSQDFSVVKRTRKMKWKLNEKQTHTWWSQLVWLANTKKNYCHHLAREIFKWSTQRGATCPH